MGSFCNSLGRIPQRNDRWLVMRLEDKLGMAGIDQDRYQCVDVVLTSYAFGRSHVAGCSLQMRVLRNQNRTRGNTGGHLLTLDEVAVVNGDGR